MDQSLPAGVTRTKDPGGRDALSLTLDGIPHAVVGVLPRGFQFPLLPDRAVYRPLRDTCGGRGGFCLRAFGRLADGHSVEQAQALFVQLIEVVPPQPEEPPQPVQVPVAELVRLRVGDLLDGSLQVLHGLLLS